MIKVQTDKPSTSWQVATDQAWLTVDGDGPGPATLLLGTDCKNVTEGMHLAHMMIAPAGGPARLIEVSLSR